MKKSCKISLIAILLAILAAAVAAIITRPKAEEHMTALNQETTVYLDQKYPTPEGRAIPNFKFLIAGKILEAYYDKNLNVKNGLFSSTSWLKTKDGEVKVATGAFGKIFLADKKAGEIVETIQADKSVFKDTDEKGIPIERGKKIITTPELKKEPDKLLQLK